MSARRARAWRAGALACALVTFPILVLGGAWTLNGAVRGDRVQEDAVNAAREMAGRIGALDTLMAALAGLRSGTVDEDGGTLIALAERLRQPVPSVTALGRYRRIEPAERAEFTRSMSERGLYDFRIRRPGEADAGETRPGTTAYPISMLEPTTPANIGLLGADLDAVDGLSARLERAAADDASIVVELPGTWPGGGRLMILHPAYLGTHVPTERRLRAAQSDGGFWIMVDPATLLGDSAAGFDTSVSIGGGGEEATVYRRAADTDETLVLASLHAPETRRERWRIGHDWLEVSMTPRPGIEPRLLAIAAAIAALVACTLGSALFTLRQNRRHLRNRIRHREALYRTREASARTLEAINDAVIGTDRAGVVHHLNPAAERLLGERARRATGTPLGELLALCEESGAAFAPARAIEALGRDGHAELDLVRCAAPDDTVFRATLTRAADAEDGTERHILVLRDVSDARRLTRELEYQANHDALTGCTNRHHFERRLAGLVADGAASGRSHALLYIDLDQFKIVNDTCGHAAGDRLLVEVTARLRRLARPADTLSRLGGDEFGMILAELSPEQARRRAEAVQDAFRAFAFTHDGKVFPVRASLGLVHFDGARSAIDLMAAADMACYAAKENGRDGLVVYQEEAERMALRSTELDRLAELQRALDEDAFRLHLQPIARIGPDCPEGRITHFEFLLRLADEDGREIPPWQIVAAAERYGLMRRLDRWIVTHALGIVARHAHRLPEGVGFSINLSGQSAADPGFIGFATESYARFGVDPSTVGFELTETAAISSFDTAVELLGGLRALGARVSLDDFGSGLSSFGYLKHLPVDVLKIDGQFVREIVDNEVDRTMVKAIAEIARSMHIRTVAEFVESRAVVDVLVELGIDYAQGYHIARPMPAEQALALLPGPDGASLAAAA